MAVTAAVVFFVVAIILLIIALTVPANKITGTASIPSGVYAIKNVRLGTYIVVDSSNNLSLDTASSSSIVLFTPNTTTQELVAWGTISGSTAISGLILAWQPPGNHNLILSGPNPGSVTTTQWQYTVSASTRIIAQNGARTGGNYLQERGGNLLVANLAGTARDGAQWTFVQGNTLV